MSESIIGKLFLFEDNIGEETIRYLQKIGLGRDKYKEDVSYMQLEDIYIIEFKEKPFILKTLEESRFFSEDNPISIRSISENGISFYTAEPEFGDGSIFVSINNIICIHTIEKERINKKISSDKA